MARARILYATAGVRTGGDTGGIVSRPAAWFRTHRLAIAPIIVRAFVAELRELGSFLAVLTLVIRPRRRRRGVPEPEIVLW